MQSVGVSDVHLISLTISQISRRMVPQPQGTHVLTELLATNQSQNS